MKNRRKSLALIIGASVFLTGALSGTGWAEEEQGMYYALLNEREQQVYREFKETCEALKESMTPSVSLTGDEAEEVFAAYCGDHPEAFWVDTAGLRIGLRGETCVEMLPKYNALADRVEEAKAAFYEAAQAVRETIPTGTDAYTVEKLLHDAVVDGTDYERSAGNSQNAYGALVEGAAVCTGYAKAFQVLCEMEGIPCTICIGTGDGEHHAWNIVKLEDDYYYVDSVWDDTGGIRYAYFNRTEADFEADHIRDRQSEGLPSCEGTAYRNLESNREIYGLDAASDYGVSKEDILTDCDSYQEACLSAMMEGSTEFSVVIQGEDLLSEVIALYEDSENGAPYLKKAVEQLNVSHAGVSVEAQNLLDGCFVLHHTVTY